MRRTYSLLLLGLVYSSSWAADIPAELRIDQVTVYAQGAMVTRTGSVNLPAGSHRLIVKGLPAGVDSRQLTVNMGSNSVRLGSVELTIVNEGQYVATRERELRGQIEAKTDQRTAIQDDIDTAQTQLKLLESLAANPTGGANGSSAVNGTNIATVLASIGSNAATARNKVREGKLKQRALDQEIETLKAELNKVATQRKQSTQVTVSVDASAPVTTPVALSYRVNDARWGWVYQARLDTSKKQLTLERQGRVEQGSGEDWQEVQLMLTTARPSADVGQQEVASRFLDLSDPQSAADERARGGREVMNLQRTGISISVVPEQEVNVTANKNYAAVSQTQYLVEYQVPSRVTLNATRESRLFPIGDEVFATEVLARVMPSVGRRAYLQASFKYERDTPIEAGQLQLYRDGAFVGEAATQAFLPGAEVRMPFGVDERIKVVVRDETAKSDQSTVLSKQITKETKQRFEITSYHATAMPVEVIDRIPVSKNADVKVEILKGATDATSKDLNGKAGVMLWKFDAQPQQMTAIRHYYSVRYPRDRVLETSYESE